MARPGAPVHDSHVHSEWSWDASQGDMAATCAAALRAGLTSVAFTEHADFIEDGERVGAVVDIGAYLEAVDACRDRFPALEVRSGVELGQPQMHREETSRLLARAGRELDCILGSVHVAWGDGRLHDVSCMPSIPQAPAWPEVVRSTLQVTLDLVESDVPFHVLAHLEYAKRYWPHDRLDYRAQDFEAEYRGVLTALARRGLVLEINSTRGAPPHRGLGPGLDVLQWWYEAGGPAVSFGSDAHQPDAVARGLGAAAELAAQSGFHPSENSVFWSRRTT